jgi:hypothetical protein
MMATDVLNQMLAAAAKAAGGVWNTVKGDVSNFAQNLIQDSAKITADYAAKAIDEDELKMELQMLGDYTAIIKNYTDTAIRVAAQAAFNAAIDALWTAVTTAAKL